MFSCVFLASPACVCVYVLFASPFSLSGQSESVKSSLISAEACVLSL